MVTTVIHTIKPGGGGHFTSLGSWIIGNLVVGDPGYPGPIKRNLVSLDQIEVAEVYGGGNSLAALLTVNGFTTDATRYVEIRAAAGHAHSGTWDTGKAYMSINGNTVLWSSTNMFVHITQMQGRIQNSGQWSMPHTGSGGVTYDKCILRIESTHVGPVLDSATGFITVKNSIIINDGNFGSNCFATANVTSEGTVSVYNSAIITLAGVNVGTRAALETNGGTAYVISQNNYISVPGGSGCYYSFGGSPFTKGANDATSNTEATTANLRSVPYTTATFLNVTSGSENLRPVVTSGNKLLDNGANLSGSGVTDDIIGVARPQFGAFDIGPFENDIPICWNYTARYKGSNKLFKASGCGSFPRNLQVPSNVDISTGRMVDDGILINPDEYRII